MNSDELRNRIIGLGENSFKKSYYPELKEKIEELELFYQIFEKTNDIVIVIKPENFLVKYINTSVSNNFWNKEEYLNQPVINLLGEEFLQKLLHFLENPSVNKIIIEKEHDSKIYVLEAVLNSIEISGKRKIVAIIRDVTHHLNVQQELEEKNKKLIDNNETIISINKELIKAKNKAEESNRLKSAFLANLSHEIRTPMNGILGFSSLLLDPLLADEKKEKYVNIINASTEKLLRIIDGIVDISKIAAGQLEINYDEFNVNLLLDELFNHYSNELKSRKLEIKLTLSKHLSDAESSIISDSNRLKQIFSSLLDNAIKFTHKGSIEFGYQLITPNIITFFCKDTGIGIAPNDHQLVFETFHQSYSFNEINMGGTGIGLSITKGIIELMQGRIYLKSEKGKGAHFLFELPYQPGEKKINKKNLENKKMLRQNKTILIADDQDINYYLFCEILTNSNFNLLRAKNGKEAVELFKSNSDIALILMDIKMPVMNGYEATKEIKKLNNEIPIIAQTAYALSGDEENAILEGCDGYISKPIDKEKLLELIEKFII